MKEFQNIPRSTVFIQVEKLLIEAVQQQWKAKKDIWFDGPVDIYYGRQPVILKRARRFFPFLKKLAIKIFPPYNPADVHILDEKSREFGIRLRNKLGLFWEFGEEYNHPGTEEAEDEDYRLSFIRSRLALIGAGEPIPETEEEKYNAVLERFTQEYKDFAEAKN